MNFMTIIKADCVQHRMKIQYMSNKNKIVSKKTQKPNFKIKFDYMLNLQPEHVCAANYLHV